MSRIPFRRRSSESSQRGASARRDGTTRRFGSGPAARAAASASGQTLAEYAVVLAAIAVGVMVALLFLVAGIKGRFESTDRPSPQAPFVPPAPPQLSYPATLEDCEDGGWRNYVQFRNETECKDYVEKHTP